jgi:dTDP-4-dehydrorhamnose reductase
MAKILVLGETGMLGWMVGHFLRNQTSHQVGGTTRQTDSQNYFDAEKFLQKPEQFAFLRQYDFIINCIGIIKPYCKDDDPAGTLRALRVNALFPHQLAAALPSDGTTKVIQIATDCVYSGQSGVWQDEKLR